MSIDVKITITKGNKEIDFTIGELVSLYQKLERLEDGLSVPIDLHEQKYESENVKKILYGLAGINCPGF